MNFTGFLYFMKFEFATQASRSAVPVYATARENWAWREQPESQVTTS